MHLLRTWRDHNTWYIHIHVNERCRRKEERSKEGRKKQARSNKQQGKATQHTQGSHSQKNELPWVGYMYIHFTFGIGLLSVEAFSTQAAEWTADGAELESPGDSRVSTVSSTW